MPKDPARKTRPTAKRPRPAVAAKPRVFVSKGFRRDASKAGISDAELCQAAAELCKGQGDDLGGNVWKKRLNENRSRSILVTKPKEFWIFSYLFDKSDRANIDAAELETYKKLAVDYGLNGQSGMDAMVAAGKMTEICNERDEENRN